MGKEGWAGQENKGMGREEEKRKGRKRYFHDKCSCFPCFPLQCTSVEVTQSKIGAGTQCGGRSF